MKKELPDCYKRKIVVDDFVKQEAKKEVVDFDEYKRLKQQQRQTFNQCANHGKR